MTDQTACKRKYSFKTSICAIGQHIQLYFKKVQRCNCLSKMISFEDFSCYIEKIKKTGTLLFSEKLF